MYEIIYQKKYETECVIFYKSHSAARGPIAADIILLKNAE